MLLVLLQGLWSVATGIQCLATSIGCRCLSRRLRTISLLGFGLQEHLPPVEDLLAVSVRGSCHRYKGCRIWRHRGILGSWCDETDLLIVQTFDLVGGSRAPCPPWQVNRLSKEVENDKPLQRLPSTAVSPCWCG